MRGEDALGAAPTYEKLSGVVRASQEDVMSDDAPKRSYELAMERLRKKDQEAGGDDRPLTDAQKSAIAEVRQFHKAKSAELEILHQAALRKATTHEEIDQLNENLRRDSERLAGERDRKIDEIRKSAVS